MSGPPRTPTAILDRRGSWLGKTRKNEPKPAPCDIAAPKWLSKEAKVAWDELAPRLEKLGVLTELDIRVLARYCVYWVLWTTCLGEEQSAMRYEMERYAIQLRHLERELGLTPAARASIRIPDKKIEKDKFLRVV